MKNIIFQTKGKKISEANNHLSDKKIKYFRDNLGIQGQKNDIFQTMEPNISDANPVTVSNILDFQTVKTFLSEQILI